MKPIRYSVLIWAVCFALLLSALNTAPAFADEATPPVDEPTSSEEVVVETETATSEEEEATPPDVSEVDSVADEESTTVAEVIESLPQDTTLVVIDENGEALPLASAEAQEIIEVADPQWCPVGVTPGSATCSGIKNTFNGGDANLNLLAWLLANQVAIGKAGVIWIDEDYTSAVEGAATEVVLDGLNYTTMDNFALTINGGWTGTGTTLNPNNPSEFNVPFHIVNWTGAVTINNILITGAAGAGVQALNVVTAGNITVNNVDVVSNTTEFSGAQLSNVSGTGNVVVNDSTFNDNTGSANSGGLSILSNGTVTLKNVTANGNSLYGVNISNTKAVTLNGTNHFSYNGEIGLSISTQGVITLNNITAMGNTFNGAYLDNCDYNTGTSLCNFGVASAVTIKGTNNFSDNGWDGLRVYSGGVITVSNITANGNGTNPTRSIASAEGYDAFGKGALLHNYGALTAKNIVLSGANTFNGNESNGLTAISYGMITVNNITANQNGCDILFDTDTSYCAGAYLNAYMGITQTGYGRFSDNTDDGLQVISYFKGNVILNNLFADGNGDYGVYVYGDGLTSVNVTINGSNVFTNNTYSGLYIDTDGTITLNNLTANYNGGDGVYAYNAYLTKAVTLKGVNTFNGNTNSGLYVNSFGAITTNAITAVSNELGNGAFLDNCIGVVCTALTAQAITMNGNNFFDDNGNLGGYTGLYVASRGAITINNLTSTYNTYDGATIDNSATNAVGGVTIKGYAYVTNNAQSGLAIFSNGAISLINVTANLNGAGSGVIIDNNGFLAPANVTITGTNEFNDNGASGLIIDSLGSVTLNNLTANGNATGGAFIDNNNGTLAKTVTLNGNNTFNANGGTGLYIESLGAIKVNNVMANNNVGVTSDGAYLNNGLIENQPVTITGFGIFNNNGALGLNILSNGNITIANLTANDNTDRGAYIETQNNLNTTTYASFTLTGVNTFNGNGLDGLVVYTDGNITVSNITANNNVGNGAYLDNETLANLGVTGIRTVTVNGVNMFNGNLYGLQVYSKGTVSLTRITANYNNGFVGSDGLLVQTDGAINLTCGSMYGNADRGYDLIAGVGKVVTIKGVFTHLNLGGNSATPTSVITRTCALP